MAWLDTIFLNPAGLLALLALIPFIVFYIIKPKPKKVVIPSLMFFIRDKANSNMNSFLQQFFKDFLFFVQLIVLLLLTLAVAKPFLVVPSISYSDSMVLVIDASASMAAVEDGESRFEKAIDIALDRVEGKNTVILSTDRSQLIVENEGRGDTINALKGLKVRETTSGNFYDSIVLAENFANTDNSAVLVLSDFSSEKLENDFLRAKVYLESKGINVFFEDVSENSARNVGIIDLDVKDTEAIVWIKNFNDEDESVILEYGDKKDTILIEANDVISSSVTTLPGKSTIKIKVDDDFEPDNYAYISEPEGASIDILLITNEEERYFKTALELMNKVNVNVETPPIVQFGNPDIIVLGNINKDVMIPGDITKVKTLAKERGIPVIIMAQDRLLDLGLGSMFPLELIKSDPVEVSDIVVPTQPDSYLTPAEIQFGQIRKLYQLRDNGNVITYAKTSQNEYPVITLASYGRGKVMYYGIFDEDSDFKADIFYPIFWKRALDVLLGGKTLGEINKNTGFLQVIGKEQIVDTPSGKRTGKAITLDYTGFYEFEDFTIAANLLSELESRLNKGELSIEESGLDNELKKMMNDTKERELTYMLLAIAGILLAFEFFFLKFRGDI